MANISGFRQTSTKMSKQHFKVCFCFNRMFRLNVAEAPEEIKNIFDMYSHDGHMSMEDLYNFLVKFQGEKSGDATMKHAQDIFDSLKHLHIFQRKVFQFDAFFRYLLGDRNGPLAEVILVVEEFIDWNLHLNNCNHMD